MLIKLGNWPEGNEAATYVWDAEPADIRFGPGKVVDGKPTGGWWQAKSNTISWQGRFNDGRCGELIVYDSGGNVLACVRGFALDPSDRPTATLVKRQPANQGDPPAVSIQYACTALHALEKLIPVGG